MIVFTDGWSNKGPEPEEMARDAIAQGFELYSVSYTVCACLMVLLSGVREYFVKEKNVDVI